MGYQDLAHPELQIYYIFFYALEQEIIGGIFQAI